MSDPTELIELIEFEAAIFRRSAWCRVDRRRQLRNGRRGGRTMLAAGRLAGIYLTRALRAEGLTACSPLELSADAAAHLHRRDVIVTASVRAYRRPAGIPEGLEFPPWQHTVTFILPKELHQ